MFTFFLNSKHRIAPNLKNYNRQHKMTYVHLVIVHSELWPWTSCFGVSALDQIVHCTWHVIWIAVVKKSVSAVSVNDISHIYVFSIHMKIIFSLVAPHGVNPMPVINILCMNYMYVASALHCSDIHCILTTMNLTMPII